MNIKAQKQEFFFWNYIFSNKYLELENVVNKLKNSKLNRHKDWFVFESVWSKYKYFLHKYIIQSETLTQVYMHH